MDSKFKHGPFEYINLDGKNVGATMRLQHRSTTKGTDPKGDCCCCINIYVNNNVQGVSNSVLHDSEVRMRDPGISLYFEDLKVNKGTPTHHKRLLCWGDRLGFCLCILILLALLFLLVLLFSTRIIIFIVWNPGTTTLYLSKHGYAINWLHFWVVWFFFFFCFFVWGVGWDIWQWQC